MFIANVGNILKRFNVYKRPVFFPFLNILFWPFFQVIEQCENRMEEKVDDIVEMIVQVLPPHPLKMDSNEEIGEDQEENVEWKLLSHPSS